VSTQILLQEKLSGAFKYRQNHLAAGALPPLLALWAMLTPDNKILHAPLCCVNLGLSAVHHSGIESS